MGVANILVIVSCTDLSLYFLASVQQFHLTYSRTFYTCSTLNLCKCFGKFLSSFHSVFLVPWTDLHYNCSQLLYSMLFVQCAHGMMFCLWNSNLLLYSSPSTRVRNSQLDATTKQNANLDPEWLELRTTLHVVRGYTRSTPQDFGSLSAPHYCLDPRHVKNKQHMHI